MNDHFPLCILVKNRSKPPFSDHGKMSCGEALQARSQRYQADLGSEEQECRSKRAGPGVTERVIVGNWPNVAVLQKERIYSTFTIYDGKRTVLCGLV